MQEAVTIVSGLPRSGTSMMMQMLEAGGIPALTDNVRRADIDNPKGYYEYERVKQVKEDTAWLPAARGKVVKMVYRLLYDLPADFTYRVVFMCRTLEEVVESQEEMLQRLGKPGAPVEAGRLVDIYRRQLDEVEGWLEQQPNFGVLYLEYHDVLEDTPRVVDRLNAFLGGSLNTAAMRSVPEPRLYRQRR